MMIPILVSEFMSTPLGTCLIYGHASGKTREPALSLACHVRQQQAKRREVALPCPVHWQRMLLRMDIFIVSYIIEQRVRYLCTDSFVPHELPEILGDLIGMHAEGL